MTSAISAIRPRDQMDDIFDPEDPVEPFNVEDDSKNTLSSMDRKFLKYGIPCLVVLVIVVVSLVVIVLKSDNSADEIFMSGTDNTEYNTLDTITHKASIMYHQLS